jgi:hypothetical protein
MLGSGRTVISVPALALRNVDVPGSVFDAEKLRQVSIAEDLRRAFELVATVCKKPLCMTRPEIFTHGAARRWLGERLGSVRNHICLSDGSAIKVIDGLENHLFVFRSGPHKNSVALRNLLSWAPELFSHVRSQVNTFHAAALDGRLVQPPTTLLLPKARHAGVVPEFLEFFVNGHAAQENAQRIIDRGAVAAPTLSDFTEVSYIPFTESSTFDPIFSRLLAQKIAATYFNPEHCVLIRLPEMPDDAAPWLTPLTAALEAIRGLGIVLPKVPARNVLLLQHDVPESFFGSHQDRVIFTIDESFDFWRYTQAFYRRLQGVTYLFDGDRRRLPAVIQCLTSILGRPPDGRAAPAATGPWLLNWGRKKTAPRRKHGG